MAQTGTILDYKGAFATKQSKLPGIQSSPRYDVTLNPIGWDYGVARDAGGQLLKASQVYSQFGNPVQRNAGPPVIGDSFNNPVHYDLKPTFNVDPATAPPTTRLLIPPRKLTKEEKKLKKQGYTYTFDPYTGDPVWTAPATGLAGQLAAGMAIPQIANPMMQAAGLAGMLGTQPMTGDPTVGFRGQSDVTPMSYPVPINGFGR